MEKQSTRGRTDRKSCCSFNKEPPNPVVSSFRPTKTTSYFNVTLLNQDWYRYTLGKFTFGNCQVFIHCYISWAHGLLSSCGISSPHIRSGHELTRPMCWLVLLLKAQSTMAWQKRPVLKPINIVLTIPKRPKPLSKNRYHARLAITPHT